MIGSWGHGDLLEGLQDDMPLVLFHGTVTFPWSGTVTNPGGVPTFRPSDDSYLKETNEVSRDVGQHSRVPRRRRILCFGRWRSYESVSSVNGRQRWSASTLLDFLMNRRNQTGGWLRASFRRHDERGPDPPKVRQRPSPNDRGSSLADAQSTRPCGQPAGDGGARPEACVGRLCP